MPGTSGKGLRRLVCRGCRITIELAPGSTAWQRVGCSHCGTIHEVEHINGKRRVTARLDAGSAFTTTPDVSHLYDSGGAAQ